MNGLVEWNASKLQNVTVRLMCDTEPGFVDYTFPTKRVSDGKGSNIADPYSWANSYSYEQRYPISAMISDDPLKNDKIDIRITVNEAAETSWKLCASALIYDEQFTEEQIVADSNTEIHHASGDISGRLLVDRSTKATMDYIRGQFLRIYYGDYAASAIKWVSGSIHAEDTIDASNTRNVVERWTLEHIGNYRQSDAAKYLFVVHDGKVYRPTGTISSMTPNVAGRYMDPHGHPLPCKRIAVMYSEWPDKYALEFTKLRQTLCCGDCKCAIDCWKFMPDEWKH